jgi:carbon monoxide dehydrogenase subunit G
VKGAWFVVELDHPFSTARSVDESWSTVLDLERMVGFVQGGSVLDRAGPETVRAEIKVKMGAMSMKFTGTVSVVERDAEIHRAVLQVKSREAGGQGHANADVVFTLQDGGGNVHTAAQITGKAASMGEGVVTTVLDALIRDFTERFAAA